MLDMLDGFCMIVSSFLVGQWAGTCTCLKAQQIPNTAEFLDACVGAQFGLLCFCTFCQGVSAWSSFGYPAIVPLAPKPVSLFRDDDICEVRFVSLSFRLALSP